MIKAQGTKGLWLGALRADTAAIQAAVHDPVTLTTQVPSCPDWTVGELLHHLGSIYLWVRGHAGRGVTEPPPSPAAVAAADAPATDHPAIIDWFTDQCGQMINFLEVLDPELPAWNRWPQAKIAAFWHRRMAHETALHRWDAQFATGLPEPIEAKLAADTVTELFDTLLVAGLGRGNEEQSGLVQLLASDLVQEWYVRLRGRAVALLDTDTLLDDDEHPARASATSTASDLALFLWGRLSVEILETTGDDALLNALRIS